MESRIHYNGDLIFQLCKTETQDETSQLIREHSMNQCYQRWLYHFKQLNWSRLKFWHNLSPFLGFSKFGKLLWFPQTFVQMNIALSTVARLKYWACSTTPKPPHYLKSTLVYTVCINQTTPFYKDYYPKKLNKNISKNFQ